MPRTNTQPAPEFARTRRYSAQERAEAAARLRELLPPGGLVYLVEATRSRTRWYAQTPEGLTAITHLVAQVLDYTQNPAGIETHEIHHLAAALFRREGYPCLKTDTGRCPSSWHVNDEHRCTCGHSPLVHGELINPDMPNDYPYPAVRNGNGPCHSHQSCACQGVTYPEPETTHHDGYALRREWL